MISLDTFSPHDGVVIVTHDLHPYGAQRVTATLARSLVEDFGRRCEVVSLGDGPLALAIRSLVPVHNIGLSWKLPARELALLFHAIHARGYRRAILNTVISGVAAPLLHPLGWRQAGLVHEMPELIAKEGLQPRLDAMLAHADVVVYPHAFVENRIAAAFPLRATGATVQCFPQGLVRRSAWRGRRAEARAKVRASLGVADDIPIVLGVGTGDLRKGIDLFIEVARIVNEDRQYRCAFIWIGAVDAVVRNRLSSEGRWPDPTPPWLHLVGFQEDTAPYHSAADVLALTSREDPFPNVVLESMDAGVPVLAFARTGGGAHLAATLAGAVSPPFDLNEYVTHLVGLLLDGERRARIGAACQARVDAEHDFRHYTARILALLDGDVVNAHVPMGVVNP